MPKPKILILVSLLLWLSRFSFAQEPQLSFPRISTEEEISAEFATVPCKNKDRLAAVKALFEKMGAKPDEVTIEKYGGVENIFLRKAGVTPDSADKIVIGAHFDKTPDGCGAVDNWSGISALAHIYRTVKDLPMKKTVIFIGFGEEEKGLIGSSAITGKIKKEQAGEYCAMINIDSLGLTLPQVADNLSSKKFMDFTVDLGKQMNLPVTHGNLAGAGADSQSYLKKKIPAVTIHGLSNDWPKTLHSSNDKPEKVNRQSVYLGYRLALVLLTKVDESPCDAFREDKDKGGNEKK
jgi:Iap family predicted aminopeptidase